MTCHLHKIKRQTGLVTCPETRTRIENLKSARAGTQADIGPSCVVDVVSREAWKAK